MGHLNITDFRTFIIGDAYVTVGKDKSMVFTLLGGTEMKA